MARLDPLPPESTPALKEQFDFFISTVGFTPNSVLTMQRRPKLVQALAQLNAAVMDLEGDIDPGFRRLVGHVASAVAGSIYSEAHSLLGAANFGVPEEKLRAIRDYASSPLYSERERVALDFARAGAAQPNTVTDELFDRLRSHWSEGEVVELLGVVAMYGFLNRWNDSMATPLEAIPMAVAERVLGGSGWKPGRHAR
jgi:alkylhydroperoxidase family enzyme